MAVGHLRYSVSPPESHKATTLFELPRETGLTEFRYLNITEADGRKDPRLEKRSEISDSDLKLIHLDRFPQNAVLTSITLYCLTTDNCLPFSSSFPIQKFH